MNTKAHKIPNISTSFCAAALHPSSHHMNIEEFVTTTTTIISAFTSCNELLKRVTLLGAARFCHPSHLVYNW